MRLRTAKSGSLGAILVFLPGWQDIQRVQDALLAHPLFSTPSRAQVLPLHSSLPSREQRRVFRRAPPHCRKIVLATNIAEVCIPTRLLPTSFNFVYDLLVPTLNHRRASPLTTFFSSSTLVVSSGYVLAGSLLRILLLPP